MYRQLPLETQAEGQKPGQTSANDEWVLLSLVLLLDYSYCLKPTGRLTAKADVYSFGVVLLELLSGRRALDKSKVGIEQNLVDWVRPYLNDKRKLYRIMDTKLEGQYPKKGAHALANIASQCIQNEAKIRPRMSEVLASLEQLQDPKFGVLPPQIEKSKVSNTNTVMKSPVRSHPSPHWSSAGGSPLPPHRRSAQIHWWIREGYSIWYPVVYFPEC